MPNQQETKTLLLTPARVVMVTDALTLAIDHYSRRAELRRQQSENLSTIGHRREAKTEADDLTEHTHKLRALAAELAKKTTQ